VTVTEDTLMVELSDGRSISVSLSWFPPDRDCLILWIGAQLSLYLVRWLSSEFGVEAKLVRDLGLRDARDCEIFSPLGKWAWSC
jgi:hypothetical protein